MRCHVCDRPADVEVASGGVVVGLCRRHLRERVRELAEADPGETLRDGLDARES